MPVLRDLRMDADADDPRTALGTVVCETAGVVAGLAVAKEVFARVGARLRLAQGDGDRVSAEETVAEAGGPLAALRWSEGPALAFLARLSGVATSAAAGASPVAADPLEAWAAELGRAAAVSGPLVVGDNHAMRFRLDIEGIT